MLAGIIYTLARLDVSLDFILHVSVFVLFVVLLSTFSWYFAAQGPGDIPLVRDAGRKTFRLSTYIAYFTNAPELLREAYEVYLKHGRACRIPSFGFGRHIALPGSALRWMSDKSPSELHLRAALVDLLQARWSLGHSRYISEPWQSELERKNLQTRLSSQIQGFWDALPGSVCSQFGDDSREWREIYLFQSIKAIITRASMSHIVEGPLSQSEEFIQSLMSFGSTIDIVVAAMRTIPRILHPILGPVVSFPRYLVVERIKRHIRPIYEERLKDLSVGKETEDEPKDFLQDLMKYLYEFRPRDLNLHFVTVQLLVFFLGACSQGSMLAPHVLFNILDSDRQYGTVSKLLEELQQVLGAEDSAKWDRALAAKLRRMDSVLQESHRINAGMSQPILRKVMVDGLVTPDGFSLPKGSTVSFLSRPVNLDPELFPEPNTFIPFRFATDGTEPDKATTIVRNKFTTTGTNFLNFGFGKFGCPGRFLVDVELKMLLAHILTHYDIEFPAEYSGRRPPAFKFLDIVYPPTRGKIRVKRKGPEYTGQLEVGDKL